MNKHDNYLDQKSVRSKVIVHTDTHTHPGPTVLPGPLQWSVMKNSIDCQIDKTLMLMLWSPPSRSPTYIRMTACPFCKKSQIPLR